MNDFANEGQYSFWNSWKKLSIKKHNIFIELITKPISSIKLKEKTECKFE